MYYANFNDGVVQREKIFWYTMAHRLKKWEYNRYRCVLEKMYNIKREIKKTLPINNEKLFSNYLKLALDKITHNIRQHILSLAKAILCY